MFPEHLRWQSPRCLLGAGLIGLLLVLPLLTHWLELGFYLSLATRIVIYAIAATGLNLILGYGGMVSFGHALFVGLGAYVVGICSYHGLDDGWLQLLIGLTVTGAVATAVGLVSLRTRAIGFIMITLAFAQMFYFLGVSLKQYGGDDGLPLYQTSILDPLPPLDDKVALYYLALAVLLLCMYLVWRIVHSRFGYVLRGFQANERRMLAAGYSRMRYQLSAFVLSALICALAGMLMVNLTTFASPSYLSWQASGEFLLIVVIGGMGTVVGPLLGAFALLSLEEALSSMTQHWMAILGPLILLAALYASRGLWGGLVKSAATAGNQEGAGR
ncbi:branched-chain amino acid ABC transporter permease [Castellaniella defragrans]|uniref:Branched-chain amino acid transport system permease protein n=1 Tax=Castellaniella defragrans TaxID=75697 RepID=A0A7W9TRK3_CASDE|nr:branched-chain amino acid ABC transporter permease [Castellaniella defragrans]KAB0620572.1 branched-chain amino acid ABC transporter permease [Castellaniella defragrans]MBB6085409.1 branched-chain amino acid transport system permease protein [Castellaniella defragrans]